MTSCNDSDASFTARDCLQNIIAVLATNFSRIFDSPRKTLLGDVTCLNLQKLGLILHILKTLHLQLFSTFGKLTVRCKFSLTDHNRGIVLKNRHNTI